MLIVPATDCILPAEMRAMMIQGAGEHFRLQPVLLDLPALRPHEILIRNHVVGVNRADILQAQGLYRAPADASPILGLEVAGEIAAMGNNVSGWQIGDRVCALTHGGGYAEYTAVPAGHALPMPETMTFAQAAAMPEALFTVTEALLERAQLQRGETLFMHGISGGVGTIAAQVARQVVGVSQVIATVSSSVKAAHAERLGATPLDYTCEETAERVMQLTQRQGADVLLDMAGGVGINALFRAARVEGRIVTLSLNAGSRAEVNMAPLLLKRLRWQGVTLRSLPEAHKTALAQRILQQIWPKVTSGAIFAVIDQSFPLEEAMQAHTRMSAGAHVGKILLTI